MVHSTQLSLSTSQRCCWIDITKQIQDVISQAGMVTGICMVASLHTTAAITINENADPDVEIDFFHKLAQMVPQDSSFRHCEGNSDSHIKTSLVGLQVQVAVENGKPVLGTWQSVYFCEFDGPRNRRCSVTLVGTRESIRSIKKHTDRMDAG